MDGEVVHGDGGVGRGGAALRRGKRFKLLQYFSKLKQ